MSSEVSLNFISTPRILNGLIEIYNHSRTHIRIVIYDSAGPLGDYLLEKKNTKFVLKQALQPYDFQVNGVQNIDPSQYTTVALVPPNGTGDEFIFDYRNVQIPACTSLEELFNVINGYLAYTGVAISKNGGIPLDPMGVVNLIEGANITITTSNDTINDRTDVTIAAAGGGGGFSYTPVAVNTTPYAVVPITGWYMYLVDATAGNITINFPTAVGNNAVYTVKKVDASANTVILTPNGAETIDGLATQTIRFQNTSVDVYSDNANLYIM
jgi:hypothetical protein